LYYLLQNCKFGHFGTYYFYVNRHYLVQFLLTDLKQYKRNNEKEKSADSELLKTLTDNKN